MPELPSVKGVARTASAGARNAVGRVGSVRRRVGPPPTVGPLARLRDRIEQREFLRLRGRFRGRKGILAFLAVMGPGLIAGIAGNDAGGITTYSRARGAHRPDAAVDLPDHDRHPGRRPGDGRPGWAW